MTRSSNFNDNFSSSVPPATTNDRLNDMTTPVAASSDAAVTQLNSLLRGSISATETYRIALEKVAEGDNARNIGLLREMQEEHGRSCQALRDRIRELGGEPSDSSGAWGVWAKTVTSVGSLFGDTAALKALKEGEEHGLKDFQEALDDVDADSADLIRHQLIPAQQRHIRSLDQMMAVSAA